MKEYIKPAIMTSTQENMVAALNALLKSSACVWKFTCPEMYEHDGTVCIANYTDCFFVYGGN